MPSQLAMLIYVKIVSYISLYFAKFKLTPQTNPEIGMLRQLAKKIGFGTVPMCKKKHSSDEKKKTKSRIKRNHSICGPCRGPWAGLFRHHCGVPPLRRSSQHRFHSGRFCRRQSPA